MMKLWLDDKRPAPEGWTRVYSVNQAIEALQAEPCSHASLDHDLGDWHHDGGDGTRLTDWMAEHDCWPSDGIRIHSSNPSGARVMLQTMDTYGPYRPGSTMIFFRGTKPAGGWPSSDTC